MSTVNSGSMGLKADQLNDIDKWLLDFLAEHEWATPNLMRQAWMDSHDHKSRQWFSQRLTRLSEHGHVEKVHSSADEYRLVDDPRDN